MYSIFKATISAYAGSFCLRESNAIYIDIINDKWLKRGVLLNLLRKRIVSLHHTRNSCRGQGGNMREMTDIDIYKLHLQKDLREGGKWEFMIQTAWTLSSERGCWLNGRLNQKSLSMKNVAFTDISINCRHLSSNNVTIPTIKLEKSIKQQYTKEKLQHWSAVGLQTDNNIVPLWTLCTWNKCCAQAWLCAEL